LTMEPIDEELTEEQILELWLDEAERRNRD
jgi:hypothetical protein